MKIKRFALIGLLSILLVSGIACGGSTDGGSSTGGGGSSTGGGGGATGPVYAGKIAFVTGGNIHLINADGSEEVRLTEGRYPIWSRNGERIACSLQEWGTSDKIGIVDIDSEQTNKIDYDSGIFDLSSDGEQIAFIIQGGTLPAPIYPTSTEGVYVSSIDGSGLICVSDNGNCKAVSFSPDGTKIAYMLYPNEGIGMDFYISNSDGTNKVLIDHEEGYWQGTIEWSPDGRIIAYDFGYDIYVVNVDGTNKAKIAEGTNPSWSPSGDKIAYDYSPSGSIDNVKIMNVDGTGQTILDSADGCWMSSQPWSPDGGGIVYYKRGGEGTDIYIADIDSDNITRLTQSGDCDNPAWCPSND